MNFSISIRSVLRQNRHLIFRLFCCLLLVSGSTTTIATYAQKKSNSRAQLESQRKAALKQISETEKMLKQTNTSATNQLRQLNILNAEIDTRKALISTMNKEVQAMDSELRGLQQTVATLSDNLKDKQTKYAAAMRHSYKWRNGYEELLFIFSATDLREAMRRTRYLHEYSLWRKQQGENLKEERRKTEQARKELDERREERKTLLADMAEEQVALKKKQNKQQQLVNQLNSKKKQLQKELSEQKKRAQALDKKIQNLIEEEARKLAEAESKQNSGKGGKKQGGNKKEMLSPEVIKMTGTFEQNKGKMAYPVNGPYAIIGRFGKQQHTRYVETINGGVILQTNKGVDACAVFDGEVKAVSQMPGYNSIVIVGHGQYFSVYTNLSKVYVKKGQKLKARDTIGLIYTDESDGLTKMEFQIRKGVTKLNPESWLKK